VAVDTYALLSSFDVRRRATGNKENVGSVLLFHASFITSSLFSLLAFQLLSLSLSLSQTLSNSLSQTLESGKEAKKEKDISVCVSG